MVNEESYFQSYHESLSFVLVEIPMVIFQYMAQSLDEIYRIPLKILGVLIFSTIPQ